MSRPLPEPQTSSLLRAIGGVYAAEIERLRRLGNRRLSASDWQRARDVMRDQAALEASRSEALLVLLGGSVNVKDLTPEQLAVLADKFLRAHE